MKVLLKFALRAMHARPSRAALTLMSIIIGVAAIVAVDISMSTTRESYREMFESVIGRAALEVVAEGGGLYSDSILPQLEKTPGVKAVVPAFQQPTTLTKDGKKVHFFLMGIDPARDAAVRDYELVEGKFFSDDGGAMMEVGFAHALGVKLNDELPIRIQLKVRPIPVVGLLAPKGAAGFNQGGIVFLPLAAMQKYYGRVGQINTASIVLETGADEKQVEAAITAGLPAGLAVRSPVTRTQLANNTIQDAEQGLKLAYTFTLVLALFIILNTFLMNVGERRRQLATLRAVGATRGQVIHMLMFEALLMGLLGTLVGAAVGLGGAALLAKVMAQSLGTASPTLHITPGPFLIAGVVGPGVSLLAMFIPAWMAGKVSPLEGMRPVIVQESRPVPLSFTIAGLCAFIVTGTILAGSVTGYLPISLAIPAGVAFTAAFVLLIPAALGVFSKIASTLLTPFLGAEGRLACRQILRRRTRTTLTVGVLYIAVSSSIGLGTAIINNVTDVRNWLRVTMPGDFFVRASITDTATGQATTIPDSLGNAIRQIDGVKTVDSLTLAEAHIGDQSVKVALREFPENGPLPLDLKSGDPKSVRRQLFDGEIVVGTTLAQRLGANVGDQVTLKTRDGDRLVRVAGTVTEYLVGGLVVHMERQTGKRLLGVDGVFTYMVTAESQKLAQAEARLKALADEHGLMLHSFADLRRRLDGMTNGVAGGLWGLLFLGLVVGGFGIANTLAMNVLEQTRELALLRVVAVTRRQVRKAILAQAALIGAIGVVAGAIGGIIGAFTTNYSTWLVLGHDIVLALDPALVVGTVVASFAIILLAAWVPAERASRLNLLIALQYE